MNVRFFLSLETLKYFEIAFLACEAHNFAIFAEVMVFLLCIWLFDSCFPCYKRFFFQFVQKHIHTILNEGK